jgi:hypothetical protein
MVHQAQAWVEGVLRALGSQQRGQKWQCPAHARTGDHSVSLSVGTRDDGRAAWIRCHGGCTDRQVLTALKINFAHLGEPPPIEPERYVRLSRLAVGFPEPKEAEGSPRQLGFRHEAFHYFGQRHRKERMRHPVTGEKAMSWESRNERGEWVPGLLGAREVDMPLYRERDIVQGMASGEPILLVESESSVDALRGWYCTTWAGGASSPPLVTIRRVLLEHRPVVIIPDHDEAGMRCCQVLRNALPQAEVRIPDNVGEDAKDVYLRLGPREFYRWVRGRS